MVSNSLAGNPEKSWQERSVAVRAVVRNGVRWVGTARAETFRFPTSLKKQTGAPRNTRKAQARIRGQTHRRHLSHRTAKLVSSCRSHLRLNFGCFVGFIIQFRLPRFS